MDRAPITANDPSFATAIDYDPYDAMAAAAPDDDYDRPDGCRYGCCRDHLIGEIVDLRQTAGEVARELLLHALSTQDTSRGHLLRLHRDLVYGPLADDDDNLFKILGSRTGVHKPFDLAEWQAERAAWDARP
jgi:hypothetical protein